MVRYSEKDLFLHEVEDAIVVARMLELQRHDDKVSDSSSSLSGDDESSSSDSESWLDSDDEPDHTLSNHLIQAHCLITQERYLVDREHDLTDSGRIMRLLDRYASTNVKLYRGMVRMSPEAFEDLTERLRSTNAFRSTIDFNRVRLQIAVGLYRMGRSGNGGGVRDIAIQCGCSWGSVHSWTAKTIEGLNELNKEVMTFATEDERARAKAWVQEKSGVEAWGRGWLAAGGTHINLAWKPALNAREHWSYKGDYTFNVALVVLPHSLRIVESVVGHPGSSHDSRVWASGTHGIVAKFRLHLDEGEFVWVDAGYGYSSYTVGPYGHKNSEKSRDLKHFNYMLSRIRIRAEHGIGYLKGRFQCLSGYRGNLYREYDHRQAALAIQACIIAHTFASRYDRPDDVAEYLKDQSSTGETAPEPSYEDATEEARRVRRDNQIQFEEDLATATAGFTPSQLSKYRADAALDLREEMTVALFEEHGRDFQDTTVESRRQGMSTASLELQRSSAEFVYDSISSASTQLLAVEILQSLQGGKVIIVTPADEKAMAQSKVEGKPKVEVANILGLGSHPAYRCVSENLAAHLGDEDGYVANGSITLNRVQVVEGGLENIEQALKANKEGVSGVKVVIRPHEA